ncbi:kelch-like protein 24 [Mya arenaria]|uniref:kelch-like protein 24 n=1 Tax=Mya arenaria TaxID=6604 RepID=UPI0022E8AB5F|nr:kelch-like protein 24 [Mya arenaria]XP_052817411.1 kelch-like protein 24 [Mya arenaria]
MTETIATWLQNGLFRLYEDGRHCDVTMIVQHEEFPCHKAVLAASSGYFDAMFSSGMIESKSEKVTLVDVRSPIFRDILRFIYAGAAVANTTNVEELLQAASLFQISQLKHHCEDILLDEISPENSVGFWVTGRALQCERLEAVAWDIISNQFDAVRKSNEIFRLENEDFLQIIKSDELYVQREENVCKTALKWIMYDESARKKFFPQVLSEMRLCQVSLEFLLEDIFSFRHAHYDESCIALLKNAVKYHALPDRRHTFDSLKVRPRNNCTDVALTIVLGRRYQQGKDSISEAECIGYNVKEHKWYSICSLPVDIGDNFVTCPYGNDVFVSGGTMRPNSLFFFSSKQFKWLEKTKMKTGRYRHTMVGVKDSLYVLGGYNFGTVSSVEEYDIPTNTWETTGELLHAVDASSGAVHGERIFLFGGWKGFTEETAIIQCFDTRTNTCSVVGNLPSPQRNTFSVTFNKQTYITFTNGEIHKFKPDAKINLVHKLENFNRKNFGTLKTGTAMYVLGGSLNGNDQDDEDCTNVCDVITDVMGTDHEITVLPKNLPVAMEVYGCFQSVIRQKYPLVEFNELLDFL